MTARSGRRAPGRAPSSARSVLWRARSAPPSPPTRHASRRRPPPPSDRPDRFRASPPSDGDPRRPARVPGRSPGSTTCRSRPPASGFRPGARERSLAREPPPPTRNARSRTGWSRSASALRRPRNHPTIHRTVPRIAPPRRATPAVPPRRPASAGRIPAARPRALRADDLPRPPHGRSPGSAHHPHAGGPTEMSANPRSERSSGRSGSSTGRSSTARVRRFTVAETSRRAQACRPAAERRSAARFASSRVSVRRSARARLDTGTLARGGIRRSRPAPRASPAVPSSQSAKRSWRSARVAFGIEPYAASRISRCRNPSASVAATSERSGAYELLAHERCEADARHLTPSSRKFPDGGRIEDLSRHRGDLDQPALERREFVEPRGEQRRDRRRDRQVGEISPSRVHRPSFRTSRPSSTMSAVISSA